jgi:hypothetical protein
MNTRFVWVALLLCTLCVAGSGLQANEEGQTRKCEFCIENPPILVVGPCVRLHSFESEITVLTNCRTTVCFTKSDFVRFERDCDCKPLGTYDVIPLIFAPTFSQIDLCPDGRAQADLQVKPLGGDCWCVNPHRGGYVINIKVAAGTRELCDDCGVYTGTVSVTITTNPCEETCPPGLCD